LFHFILAARARAGVLSLVFKKILKQHNHNATVGQVSTINYYKYIQEQCSTISLLQTV